MSIADRILLRKRALIETVNDEVEKHCTDRTLTTSFFQQFHCQFIICYRSLLFLLKETRH